MNDTDFSKVYSFSKLELFDKCPKQYYFNYLDPEIAPIKKQFIKPRDYKTKGQAVHGAITLFYYLSPKKQTFENLKKCLKQSWFSELNINIQPPLSLLGGFKDIEHERRIYIESLKLLRNFFKLEKKQNPSLFYIPSKTIKDSFSDYSAMIKPVSDNFFISGKFDRIDELDGGGLRIIDFKTGRTKNGISQLEFYKLLAEVNFAETVKEVSYHYLNEGEIKSFDVSKVKTKDIKDKVLEKIKKISKTKEFKPNPSRLCNHCDFKEICPTQQK